MLTIDLEYGYNNAAKSGRVLPATVWIDNPEEQDFSGTLEILTRESDGQVYACTYEVSAEAGEVSSFPCAVPLGRGADSLLIRAVYEDGSTAAEKDEKLYSQAELDMRVNAECEKLRKKLAEAEKEYLSGIRISLEEPPKRPLIYKVIT